MAKDPAFLFYPNDFSSGTQFFSDEQVGKYMRLLMAQHQHGHLTENQVIFICKSYDKDVMSKFTKDSGGLWFNERLEIEMDKRKNFVLSRSKNKEGKTKEKIISKSYDFHMENKDENVNEDYILIGETRCFDIRKLLEFYEAALNGRVKEHSLPPWRTLVHPWFSQNRQLFFKDEKHVFNAFSKHIIDSKKNGSSRTTTTGANGQSKPAPREPGKRFKL